MKPFACEFESEVLAAVLQSRWPERVEPEFRAHVAACEICSDVVAIAGAFDEARDDMRTQAVVPDAGRVWRLAQLRARRDAVEAAGRPIVAVQLVAFACAIGLLGACWGATSTWFQSALGFFASALAGFDAKALLASATALAAEHGLFVLGLAAVVFLIPTAVYVALGRD